MLVTRRQIKREREINAVRPFVFDELLGYAAKLRRGIGEICQFLRDGGETIDHTEPASILGVKIRRLAGRLFSGNKCGTVIF